ncbi:Eukaryotic translation initiation factor 4E-binding protein 1 [Trichoplax sp. H2]|uniref:Uncharacterized protein n=1 Tax=Trichoplax adhaerens TaxID=10228 RepID=B3S633_TRIAD|nr:hypothetical protein TRIADDRAFT_59660 [Trichoplax adhaerens]EDV21550.1 hypothetical protein TRIADDRAFT_59660 [Trichoplax adhaerens]RDD47408.1 Eukaryotic translation initiation factor 4E-binding protein 1 [Trichoplax sp. H2]|eukprot:XP_002115698.1 hypothetical protein TRIADDRAFT_59660 [Trichoplax adhaerens]
MSDSTRSKTVDIPFKRILVTDPCQLPNSYSTTPGGTIFSTTPGGTRIIYDRAFLLQMRNSPHAQIPPSNLPNIPGVTSPPIKEDKFPKSKDHPEKSTNPVTSRPNVEQKEDKGEEEQFAMEMEE